MENNADHVTMDTETHSTLSEVSAPKSVAAMEISTTKLLVEFLTPELIIIYMYSRHRHMDTMPIGTPSAQETPGTLCIDIYSIHGLQHNDNAKLSSIRDVPELEQRWEHDV